VIVDKAQVHVLQQSLMILQQLKHVIMANALKDAYLIIKGAHQVVVAMVEVIAGMDIVELEKL